MWQRAAEHAGRPFNGPAKKTGVPSGPLFDFQLSEGSKLRPEGCVRQFQIMPAAVIRPASARLQVGLSGASPESPNCRERFVL